MNSIGVEDFDIEQDTIPVRRCPLTAYQALPSKNTGIVARLMELAEAADDARRT
jgi:hypothetical protein